MCGSFNICDFSTNRCGPVRGVTLFPPTVIHVCVVGATLNPGHYESRPRLGHDGVTVELRSDQLARTSVVAITHVLRALLKWN